MMANVLGTDIYYESVGEGPAIVFLHGLGGTCNVWHGQRHGLSKFFQVITVDLPGSGRSDKTEKTYSMERWTDQVLGLAEALKLDKFTLVGHSMTTILAQKVAAKAGSRLTAVVLCGPMTELTDAGKEAFRKRAASVQSEGMLAVADSVVAGALSPATREANPVLTGMYRELLLSHDPASYAAQCLALVNASAKADQPRIKCPTLILLGDQDGVTSLSSARAIAAAIPGAQIRVIPATAHLTMAERPDILNATLIEFLGRL